VFFSAFSDFFLQIFLKKTAFMLKTCADTGFAAI
jgi:hypothetical protein